MPISGETCSAFSNSPRITPRGAALCPAAPSPPGGATANIIVVDAILTPRMREEDPDKEFPTFTPAEHVADAIAWLQTDPAGEMNGARLALTMP